MKILLLVDSYWPQIKSVAVQMRDLAVALQDQGHEITVLTADVSLPRRRKITVARDGGVKVIKVRAGTSANVPKWKRLISELLLSRKIWRYGKRELLTNRCDCIVFYSPSIFFSGIVKKLKKYWCCKVYMILRDIFPQWTVDLGILRRNGIIYNWLNYFAKQQYKVADIVGVQTPANLEYFKQKSWAQNVTFEVLYNWKKIFHVASPAKYREQLRLVGKVVFVYSGNMGVTQDINSIILVAEKLLDRKDIHFLFVGRGRKVKYIKKQIKQQELTNVTLYPSLHYLEHLEFLSEFDIGLITLDKRFKTHNFPGKTLDYMMLGLPIIANINIGNDLKNILSDANAGLVCDSGDVDSLLRHVVVLANNKKLRDKMGENGRRLLEQQFEVNKIAQQIISSVEKENG
ncbi:MAG: glycosyltransferase family 4 protein [Gammaproteobacteria bacterium]|jgi:glycosyltransferase involved in cell wall biosynthesis